MEKLETQTSKKEIPLYAEWNKWRGRITTGHLEHETLENFSSLKKQVVYSQKGNDFASFLNQSDLFHWENKEDTPPDHKEKYFDNPALTN